MDRQFALSHPFPPVFDARSRVLVLGSFPSARSRAEGFYYGHPQNRFWRVLAAVFGRDAPEDVAEKRALLLSHGVALWDVAARCDIEGSADSSLRNAVANDFSAILPRVSRVYANGKTAKALYDRLVLPKAGREIVALPSTSAANAAWSLERLIEAWKIIGRQDDLCYTVPILNEQRIHNEERRKTHDR